MSEHEYEIIDDSPKPGSDVITNGTFDNKGKNDQHVDITTSNEQGIAVGKRLKKGQKKNKGKKEDDDEDEEEKPKGPPPVSMIQLFRYAQGVELLFLFGGILMAWVNGLCMPAMTILFGNMTNAMVDYGSQSTLDLCYGNATLNFTMPNGTFDCDALNWFIEKENITDYRFPCMSKDDFMDQIWSYSVGLSIIGTINIVLGYAMVAFMNIAAERQVFRIRNLFFKSVLRQDIAWYDTHQTGEFASRTADDLIRLQDGIGEKIGMFNFFCSTFLFSIINAFIHGWQLTLVILSVTPVMVIALGGLGKIQTSLAKNEMKAYAKAGSLAEEVLTAIRTVAAFGGEKKEQLRYDMNLKSATKAGIKRGFTTAIGAGVLWFMIFSIYALAFWYGVKLILEPEPTYTASNLVIVFFSVFMGAMNMGQSAPYIEAFAQARAAAAAIYQVVDRVPPIDSSSSEGLKLDRIDGNFEFENVFFNYPSRPDVKILDDLCLKVKNGETVALVGESGCGKSTTVQLIQRFYDPFAGTVKLDGCDIRLLNIGWLRDQIGIVGQEPILFGTTIGENIKYGFDGATQEDVEKAAKMANAHNFIMKLPKKYDTMVGDRGTQLSGGQKQRVAIARALIKNPKILLLDEATSALDSESEAVVQQALDKARLGRTTLIIAHRLSTIRNADKIAAIQGGRVVEMGTHAELMAREGIYHTLVTTQTGEKDKEQLGAIKEVDENKEPLRELQRSISEMTENSVTEVMDNAAFVVGHTPSFRRRRRVVSVTSVGSGAPVKEESISKELHPSLKKVLKYNKEEWLYIALGCLGALGMGFTMPAFSIVFGDVMGVLSNCDKEETEDRTNFYSCMFLVIGVCACIASFMQIFCFTYAGEYLTRRLRQLSFKAMLNQEIGWFDDSRNSVGALCTRLSADAASVQGATGSRIGTIIQSFCTLGAASVISLILCWQLALVAICFIPFILLARYGHAKIIRGQTLVEMDSFDVANRVAIECITNIRTVASLHKENRFHEIYISHLVGPHKKAIRESHLRGLIFGFAQSTTFFTYAATMYYGGTLVLDGRIDYSAMFKVSQLIIMGTSMVAQAFAFAPNYSKGIVSAARIFLLLEKKSLIDSSIESGLKLPDDTEGMIRFKQVEFKYPSRIDVPVLRGLDLDVKPGNVLALVGSSGCGKSTCIQLLERFYDPAAGKVTMDGTDITQLNIGWLRSRIGIVSQEPILFDRSIAENISYGDNNREVGMDEVIQAAKNANIHNFITTLPHGYETSVGDKGAQLSGGQKQRIAIARALVRNPKILLLDEATSALDTESEKVVQEALEQAQRGRTCITVAHRLSTIKDANQIAVIHHGKVVELGTHDELIAQHGHYFRFYQTQAKGHS